VAFSEDIPAHLLGVRAVAAVLEEITDHQRLNSVPLAGKHNRAALVAVVPERGPYAALRDGARDDVDGARPILIAVQRGEGAFDHLDAFDHVRRQPRHVVHAVVDRRRGHVCVTPST
jgi:hypothetical protein